MSWVRVLLLCCCAVVPAKAAPILTEDFEDGVLDPRISVQTVGTFNTPAGIQNLTDFGSTKAFGFGLSTCGASCFFSFVNTLHISLLQPTFVATIAFDEKEKFDNWGSDGAILINGSPLGTGFRDFGRLPYNDRQPDTNYRSQLFNINQVVSTIDIRVEDITNLSEIFLDNLAVIGDQ